MTLSSIWKSFEVIYFLDLVKLGTASVEYKYHESSSYHIFILDHWRCWMMLLLQVCAEQQCEDEVFSLSVNYLDRVLSVLVVRRSQLQLVAAVCMFVASKFKDTTPLSAHCLVIYTDCSITMGDLLVRRIRFIYISIIYFILCSVHFIATLLTLWRPLLHVCTTIKHPVPDRVIPSFVIFDIRALWRSGLSVRLPGCRKLQLTA